MPEEFSESGAPIQRYDSPAERKWTLPDTSDSNINEIERHIEAHIGKVDSVLHEILSDLVHIDVHIVKPTTLRPYSTLITSGMSDLPMVVPNEYAEFAYAELMLCLPDGWPLNSDQEEHYWPIRWLKRLARFPHEYKTWLGKLHSMPNGDPPEPIVANTQLCGVALGRPMTTSVDFHRLVISPKKTIQFYSVLPVYADELAFKLKEGGEALLEKMEQQKVTELLNPTRKSVVTRPWWKVF